MISRRYLPVVALHLVAMQSLTAQDSTTAKPDSAQHDRPHALKALAVVARAEYRAGYATVRTRTATKTDTPLRDVPQAATVVTRALIRDQAMQGMADVVRYVPGITMGQGEGHRDAPTIRGQSTTADFYVDGARDDAQYLRDLYNVERVEALKGSNAMMFGRGGGGGVINRVTKAPAWAHVGEISVEGGSFDHKRTTLDIGGPLGDLVATRLNALYENSGGFRRAMRVERSGVNPEATIMLGLATSARIGFEHFSDSRTVDRGIPSFRGLPAPGDVRVFFGDPDASGSRTRTDAVHLDLARVADGGVTLRNRTVVAGSDKFYQNVYANSAVNSAGMQLNLAAYNSAIARSNLFNQTDVTREATTGAVKHTLLVGTEFGRQSTDNHRNTGYFNNSATSAPVSLAVPTVASSVTFRQSATDADNHVVAGVAAAYVQDQLTLGRHIQGIVGLRVDQFAVRFYNNRVGATPAVLARTDRLVSPRLGLVVKPIEPLSLYATQSVSHLPSSGDQFSSLTVTTQTLEPELFTNRELGAKWDVRSDLALTAAVYRLERSNSVATDPLDPSRVVLTGRQRTNGLELGASGNITGRWQVASGFAVQRARIVSATTSAKAGATIPLVPERTASLWNKVRISSGFALGLGLVHQAQSFAAVDNTVTLPAFTRADGGAFFTFGPALRAQVNVENVTNTRYYWTSHGNNNILPGALRTVRVALAAGW